MKRVLVVGCGGSGKSTLTRQIAQSRGLPLFHLDAHYWRPGWQEPDKTDWVRQVEAIAAQDSWVIDGNYTGTMPPRFDRADTMIFIDLPTHICLARVIRRAWQWLGRTRADMAVGCPEKLDWAFLRFVWTFRPERRQKMIALLNAFPRDRIYLGSRRAIQAYVDGL